MFNIAARTILSALSISATDNSGHVTCGRRMYRRRDPTWITRHG
jgi:hypothetical protein